MPKHYDSWEAEEDARAMMRVAKCQACPKRRKRAQKAFRKMEREAAEENKVRAVARKLAQIREANK